MWRLTRFFALPMRTSSSVLGAGTCGTSRKVRKARRVKPYWARNCGGQHPLTPNLLGWQSRRSIRPALKLRYRSGPGPHIAGVRRAASIGRRLLKMSDLDTPRRCSIQHCEWRVLVVNQDSLTASLISHCECFTGLVSSRVACSDRDDVRSHLQSDRAGTPTGRS